MRPFARSLHLIVCAVCFMYLAPSARAEPPSLGGETPQATDAQGLPIDEEKVAPVQMTQPGPASSPVAEGAVPPSVGVSPECDFWQAGKLDYTWLAGSGGASLQIHDIEASTTFAVPVGGDWAPVTFRPGVGVHFWEGPAAGRGPGLPPTLYDSYVDIGWRPKLAPWLYGDLVLTPGFYSDYKDFNSETFQLRGRALAIVAFSPEFQLVGGALYVNRIMTKLLPAGGFIWNPDEDTKLFCVFPQPKLARRIGTVDGTQWWAYLSGEFGGGKWSIQGDNGRLDAVDYTDWRVILGLEFLNTPGLKGHVEAGYVFNRAVRFRGNTSDTPDFKPDSTLMVRAGLAY